MFKGVHNEEISADEMEASGINSEREISFLLTLSGRECMFLGIHRRIKTSEWS